MTIKLYNQDCMNAMRDMPDDAFELAIVDPPYGIGESGKKNKSRSKLGTSKDYKPFHGDDLKAPDRHYFNELRRVSVNQIVWGGNHMSDSIGFSSPCWIVWDKVNGKTDFADCELAYTSFKTTVRKFSFTWHGMLQGDMKNKEHRIHPTQKPVKLYEWILKNYAKEGDKILDTHLGSGSIAIACHNLGYDLTGYEIDKDYYDAAVKRYGNHASQQQMFV